MKIAPFTFTKPKIGKLSPARKGPGVRANSSMDVQNAFRECQTRRQKADKPIITK